MTSQKCKDLARYIMSTGDLPGSPCARLQFKSGSWVNGNERDQGGVCEEALAELIFHYNKNSQTIKQKTK